MDDVALTHILEASGFDMSPVAGNIFNLGDVLGGTYTVADVNARYDAIITNSSDNPYRGAPHTAHEIEIGWMTAEHVETKNDDPARAGFTGAGNTGNERRTQFPCAGTGNPNADDPAELGDPTFQGISQLGVISASQGGNPDHPVVRGMGRSERRHRVDEPQRVE